MTIHEIVKDKRQRIYIEKGNTEKLSAVEALTFEPHIGLHGSLYGFNGGVLTELQSEEKNNGYMDYTLDDSGWSS